MMVVLILSARTKVGTSNSIRGIFNSAEPTPLRNFPRTFVSKETVVLLVIHPHVMEFLSLEKDKDFGISAGTASLDCYVTLYLTDNGGRCDVIAL